MLESFLQKLKSRHVIFGHRSTAPPHVSSVSPKLQHPSFTPDYLPPVPPQLSLHRLSTGIPVLIDSSPSLPRCSLVVCSGFGARDLAPAESSALFALQKLHLRTASADIESRRKTAWEVLAGDIDFCYDHESTMYQISAFKHHFPAAVQTLLELITAKKGENDHIVARARLGEYWKLRKDGMTLPARVKDLWLSQCYGESGLGAPLYGRANSVESLDIDTLNTVHSLAFDPAKSVIAVSAPAEVDRILELLESGFGQWRPNAATTQRSRERSKFIGKSHFEEVESRKGWGTVAFEGVPWTHELMPAYAVIKEVLGGTYNPRERVPAGIRKDLRAKYSTIEQFRCSHATFSDSSSLAFEFSSEVPKSWSEALTFPQHLLSVLSSLPETSLNAAKVALRLRLADVYSSQELRVREYAKGFHCLGAAQTLQSELAAVEKVTMKDVKNAVDGLATQQPAIVLLAPSL